MKLLIFLVLVLLPSSQVRALKYQCEKSLGDYFFDEVGALFVHCKDASLGTFYEISSILTRHFLLFGSVIFYTVVVGVSIRIKENQRVIKSGLLLDLAEAVLQAFILTLALATYVFCASR